MEQELDPKPAHEGWTAIVPDLPDDGVTTAPLSAARAQLWSLVLEASYIPCRMEGDTDGWQVLVPATHAESAVREIRRYEEENRYWPPPPPPSPPPGLENRLATMSVLVLLATFHNLTRLDITLFGRKPTEWVLIGSADSGKILAGQWWRTITALTLHSDWSHLLGNLAFGAVLIIPLCRELGSGLAWGLLLTAGLLGNLANAALHPVNHSSIGASTLVFGAVGIHAALNLTRYRRHGQRRWLLPAAAALALLAILGTEGKNTDLGAHLFGFIAGTLLGLLTAFPLARAGRPGRRTDAVLAFICAAAVIAAWWAGITSP